MADRIRPSITFAVGRRTCTATARHAGEAGLIELHVEWSPDIPGQLSPKELQQYIAGRDRALSWLGLLPAANQPPHH